MESYGRYAVYLLIFEDRRRHGTDSCSLLLLFGSWFIILFPFFFKILSFIISLFTPLIHPLSSLNYYFLSSSFLWTYSYGRTLRSWRSGVVIALGRKVLEEQITNINSILWSYLDITLLFSSYVYLIFYSLSWRHASFLSSFLWFAISSSLQLITWQNIFCNTRFAWASNLLSGCYLHDSTV